MELIEMRASHQESDKMSVLYEASYRGCVSTLESLKQQHPKILHEISQSSFTETPLHISALLGHHEFTKALLAHNPKFAFELDSSRRSALHLASAEGHVVIVKELLQVYDQSCLLPDEEGKIPLHYAAMRGRIEVVQELIKAKPESLSFRDNNGKTAFHLCVIYNHLETLKALVELELAITRELLNFTSSDGTGNTILHLAILLKRVETVKYLLSISEMREAANLKNKMGFAAHDILEHSPKDYKILEIQLLLRTAGIEAEKKGIDTHPPPPPVPSATTEVLDRPDESPPKDNCCIKILKIISKCLESIWDQRKDSWSKERRENLSLVATVISTITFQALINPPEGGFTRQGLSSSLNDLMPHGDFLPGGAISSSPRPFYFLRYLICITISFISSLSVVLLLVSGISIRNEGVIWMLSSGMCFTLALAYFYALYLVVPEHLWESADNIYIPSYFTWIGLLGLIGVLFIMRFFDWIVCKIKKMSKGGRNENGCFCV